MKKWYAFILFATLVASNSPAHAVSEAAALFLLIQPSVRAAGMAGTSVASFDHGPLAAAFNPAHIGFAAAERSVNVEFYPVKTRWLNIEDLQLNARSVTIGYDFGRRNPKLPISVGLGYTRVRLDLGEQTITDETGPDVLGVFQNSEHVDVFTVGASVDYLVRIGLGLSFKRVELNLASVGAGAEPGTLATHANAYDFGVLVQLPLIASYERLTNKSVKLAENFQPFLTPALGFSRSNIGDEIVFVDAGVADPLPRVARMAVSLQTGLRYKTEFATLLLASFEWSSEAEDLVVDRAEDGRISYQGLTGDIGFFDNVLAGNSSSGLITAQGWELNLLDIFSIRRGNHDDPDGRVFYESNGYGINFTGILRALGAFSPETLDTSVLGFVSQHLDIRYDFGQIDLLGETNFKGIRVSFF